MKSKLKKILKLARKIRYLLPYWHGNMMSQQFFSKRLKGQNTKSNARFVPETSCQSQPVSEEEGVSHYFQIRIFFFLSSHFFKE